MSPGHRVQEKADDYKCHRCANDCTHSNSCFSYNDGISGTGLIKAACVSSQPVSCRQGFVTMASRPIQTGNVCTKGRLQLMILMILCNVKEPDGVQVSPSHQHVVLSSLCQPNKSSRKISNIESSTTNGNTCDLERLCKRYHLQCWQAISRSNWSKYTRTQRYLLLKVFGMPVDFQLGSLALLALLAPLMDHRWPVSHILVALLIYIHI